MCMYSREHETRPMNVGESTELGLVRNHFTEGHSVVAKAPAKERGIACLCLRDGLVCRLETIPRDVAKGLSLVSNRGVATFRQGIRGGSPDRFEFDNGSTAVLNRTLLGMKITCLALNMEEYLASEAKTQARVEEPSKTLVPVGAGVLTGASRRSALVLSSMLLAMAVFTLQ